ncbi:MAG: hypothetical protein K6G00_06820 [Treponema sp.]|nr:hypothetical protein [Treponema sp.]
MLFFYKKPWNDINKYYINFTIREEDQPPMTQLFPYHPWLNKVRTESYMDDPNKIFSKDYSASKGIKLAIKRNVFIYVNPDTIDKVTFEWFISHCPRNLWRFSPASGYFEFN